MRKTKNLKQNSLSNIKSILSYILQNFILSNCRRNHLHGLFVQFYMALTRERGSITITTLDTWLSRVFVTCLFLASKIPMAMIMAKAEQKKIIIITIPLNEFPESIVYGLLVAVVQFCDRSVTIKLELITLLISKSFIFLEELWYVDRPSVCNSGIVLKNKYKCTIHISLYFRSCIQGITTTHTSTLLHSYTDYNYQTVTSFKYVHLLIIFQLQYNQ